MHPKKGTRARWIMSGRRTICGIYRRIPVCCRTPRTFTAVIGRCDLNAKTGPEYTGFLAGKGYLSAIAEGDRTRYVPTPAVAEYITLFSSLRRNCSIPGPGSGSNRTVPGAGFLGPLSRA